MATPSNFTPGAGQDNTLRNKTRDYQSPAYAATLLLTTTQDETLYAPSDLTGALAFNIAPGVAATGTPGTPAYVAAVPPFLGASVKAIFSSLSSGSTITLGTNVKGSASTLVIPSGKYGVLEFTYNGTVWVETNRTITA